MEELPELKVEMFLDISRTFGDTTKNEVLVSKFAARFRNQQWPTDTRLPTVFYDPRSLDEKQTVSSSLHAKCIVVDKKKLYKKL